MNVFIALFISWKQWSGCYWRLTAEMSGCLGLPFEVNLWLLLPHSLSTYPHLPFSPFVVTKSGKSGKCCTLLFWVLEILIHYPLGRSA